MITNALKAMFLCVLITAMFGTAHAADDVNMDQTSPDKLSCDDTIAQDNGSLPDGVYLSEAECEDLWEKYYEAEARIQDAADCGTFPCLSLIPTFENLKAAIEALWAKANCDHWYQRVGSPLDSWYPVKTSFSSNTDVLTQYTPLKFALEGGPTYGMLQP